MYCCCSQYATVDFNAHDNPISAVSASFTIWKLDVAYDGDFSLIQIWLSSMFGDREEIIEVVWMVSR
jgi:hypothetical protein